MVTQLMVLMVFMDAASVKPMLMLSTPLMAILVFHLDPALVWTQSPRVLMLLPKELFPILVTMLDTTMASVKLMLMLSTPLMAILVFHLDPALVWTQSPRVLIMLPKELFPILVTMLDMLDILMVLDTTMASKM